MYLVPPPLSYAATVKIPFGDKVVFLYQTFFFILFILCLEHLLSIYAVQIHD